jgi:hypothetical protein
MHARSERRLCRLAMSEPDGVPRTQYLFYDTRTMLTSTAAADAVVRYAAALRRARSADDVEMPGLASSPTVSTRRRRSARAPAS